ncbi:HesB/IscA family protein [Rhizobium grahamii]|uniref:Iron-sulfur cluster assembly accessory protein n=1 Tax=Rhizobium grahamii TaxID=1120045 RepID=A0A370KE67_9HYPH|nr:iron-sulfur cluster assembly accessory protein [Rhizobium grahamii]RDJ01947.1 iron-sulfur cluster assembly accessory protein [Rhizobium grahamii]
MITLTENALTVMNSALSQAAAQVEGFRIMVETGGGAGFKYVVGLESSAREGDAVVETDGVKVFVDLGSQLHVAGMTIDFVTGLESSGFVFDNPNAGERCACGKSFG